MIRIEPILSPAQGSATLRSAANQSILNGFSPPSPDPFLPAHPASIVILLPLAVSLLRFAFPPPPAFAQAGSPSPLTRTGAEEKRDRTDYAAPNRAHRTNSIPLSQSSMICSPPEGDRQKRKVENRLVERIEFTATASSRSSRPGGTQGAPGESVVSALNPQRMEKLRKLTGWSRVEPGTLNFQLDVSLDEAGLDKLIPAWVELPESVKYPAPYGHIPQLRQGWRYYRARLVTEAGELPVLAKWPVKPGGWHKTRIEVFAEVKIREHLVLSDGDHVTMIIESGPNA